MLFAEGARRQTEREANGPRTLPRLALIEEKNLPCYKKATARLLLDAQRTVPHGRAELILSVENLAMDGPNRRMLF
jgi:hypothetical protein